MEATQVAELKVGDQVTNRLTNELYTLTQKLPTGGEGVTFRASSEDGEKVVKFVPAGFSQTVSELEEKLQNEHRLINRALDTNYSAFVHDVLTLGVVGDFVPGMNLAQKVRGTNRAFTQEEVVDFMIQITENYLIPIHGEGAIHRDIKPQNVIVREAEDGPVYTLIDFGIVRPIGQNQTVTLSFQGTAGYARPFTGVHDFTDDFYSLAETGYFLLTGKEPKNIGVAEYDEIDDRNKMKTLSASDDFKKVMWKMLGHDPKERYADAGSLVKALKKISGSSGLPVSLSTAKSLAEYREMKQVPEALQLKVNGVKTSFEEKYNSTIRSRNPLGEEFLGDLEGALAGLGYVKKEGKHYEGEVFWRQRKDSRGIDVLKVLTGSEKGSRYFEYFLGDNEEDAKMLSQPLVKDGRWYEPVKLGMSVAQTLGMGFGAGYLTYVGTQTDSKRVLGGILLGGTVAFVAGWFHKWFNYSFEGDDSLVINSSRKWGLSVFGFPHTVGRWANDIRHVGRVIGREWQDLYDTGCLEKALTPAKHFTL